MMNALDKMRSSARRLKPTLKHQPIVWECMLGTIYARSLVTGQVQYFDYDYAKALAHVGAYADVRVHRVGRGYYDLSGTEIPVGKLVWFAIPANEGQ